MIPYYYPSITPEHDYAWKLENRLLKRLQADVKNIGSNFLIFYIPNRTEVYDDEWNLIKSELNLKDSCNVNHIGNCLSQICKNDSIDFIYPVKEFRSQASKLNQSKQRLYYNYDIHWNENGHHLAGEILANYLMQKNYH